MVILLARSRGNEWVSVIVHTVAEIPCSVTAAQPGSVDGMPNDMTRDPVEALAVKMAHRSEYPGAPAPPGHWPASPVVVTVKVCGMGVEVGLGVAVGRGVLVGTRVDVGRGVGVG